MAGNVELTINGVDATKAAFGSAGARATALNQKFDQLSKRQQGRLRKEGRELAQVERAQSGYLREQQRSAAAMAASNKAAGGWVTSLGLGRIAMVATAGAAAAFVRKGLQFNKAVESATIKFRAFYPTVELAEKHVKSLTGFAARTPFQLPGVLDASRLLKTFSADAAYGAETLTTVGDAAAGVGAELPNVAMWFGRLYDAAKAGRPFGEASARLQELGLISGTTRTEMEELSKSGASVEEVMALLRDEWGKHEGAMQRLSETTEGLESTFGDLVGQFAGAVVSAIGLSDAYKGLLAGSNELLTASVDLINGTRDIGAEMAELERRIGAIRADDTRWGVQSNLEEMRGQLADLKNERFWEGFNAGLEDVGATSERVAEAVPEAWEEAGFKSVEAFDKEMKKLAEVAAKEAEEAAAEATAAMAARFEKDLPLINATILEGFAEDVKWRKAGDQAGNQFAAGVFTGWASGPKALESTELAPAWLMDRMMKAGPVAGNAMSEAVVGQMAGPEAASAWDRAGGFTGMFTGMTGAVSAFATGGWKGGVMSIVNTAASLLPPGMAQAAQVAIAAFGAVWKAIKRPSEEEIAARKSFQGIHDSAVTTFGETAAYTESVQRLVSDGWDRTLAETVVGFEQAAAAAGVSHAEAVALYAQYQIAVQDGNTELVASIEETYNSWTAAADEAAAAAADGL